MKFCCRSTKTWGKHLYQLFCYFLLLNNSNVNVSVHLQAAVPRHGVLPAPHRVPLSADPGPSEWLRDAASPSGADDAEGTNGQLQPQRGHQCKPTSRAWMRLWGPAQFGWFRPICRILTFLPRLQYKQVSSGTVMCWNKTIILVLTAGRVEVTHTAYIKADTGTAEKRKQLMTKNSSH